MRSVTDVAVPASRRERLWIPRQHGAWAMLAVPLLVGIAFSRPVPSQILLAAVAIVAYLTSATLQAWLRSRRRHSYLFSIVAYGTATTLLGIALLALEPRLAMAAFVVVPAGVLTLVMARPGRPREIGLSFAHVGQASVLAPAAMLLAGDRSLWVFAGATLITAAEMAGSVLAVRSVIRERDNADFALRSIGFHAAITLAATALLPWAYAALGAGLTVRAAGLPLVRRRLGASGKQLRPVYVGVVEAAASLALVVVALAVPLTASHP